MKTYEEFISVSGDTYVGNIDDDTIENTNYRKVLATTPDLQLVLMSIRPGSEIGEEVHEGSQFLRIGAGTGKVVIDGDEFDIKEDFGIVIPGGSKHNLLNTGSVDMKVHSIYTPPEHEKDLIQKEK